jgi:hypothetical protein
MRQLTSLPIRLALPLVLVVNLLGAYEPTFTTITVPGATATFASRINAAGQIVGGFSRWAVWKR